MNYQPNYSSYGINMLNNNANFSPNNSDRFSAYNSIRVYTSSISEPIIEPARPANRRNFLSPSYSSSRNRYTNPLSYPIIYFEDYIIRQQNNLRDRDLNDFLDINEDLNVLIESLSIVDTGVEEAYNNILGEEDENDEEKYLKKEIFDKLPKENSEETCSICFEPNNTSISIRLPCGHHFHENCASEWLLKHSKQCPMCRKNADE